jgi:uncharacterized protein (TIGR02300 family)
MAIVRQIEVHFSGENQVANKDLGVKRNCPECAARFYDLDQSPATCPKCAVAFEPEVLLKSRRQKIEIKPEVKPVEDTSDLEEDDDEVTTDDTLLDMDEDGVLPDLDTEIIDAATKEEDN